MVTSDAYGHLWDDPEGDAHIAGAARLSILNRA
jgi:hypothetical protein